VATSKTGGDDTLDEAIITQRYVRLVVTGTATAGETATVALSLGRRS
jgi:hypothetical protein